MKRVAIWASGGGSNARCIIEHLANIPDMEVALIVTNRSKSGVRDIARKHHIPDILIQKDDLRKSDYVLSLVEKKYKIDLIVLAGWLMRIPPYLVDAFEGRIINIHPALLPKYGGVGMYGHHVHEAVHRAGERESGMTIHHVTEAYDEGRIILQARVAIDVEDDPSTIAAKVLALEHKYYPIVVEELLRYPVNTSKEAISTP